jgi:hypothetical protein
MRVRWIHTLLALLLLIQSVGTLAAAPVTVSDSGISMELRTNDSGDSHHTSMPPCHGDSATSAAQQPSQNCCETMEDKCCLLGCSVLASAVSCGAVLGSIDIRIHYPLDAGYASIQNPLSGLFRPPRSI